MPNIVTIFGGNGFLGKSIVSKLLQSDSLIKVVSRALPIETKHSRLTFIQDDVQNTNSLWRLVRGSTTVINLVGLLFETPRSTFQKVHINAASELANVAKQQGVKNFIHISALGVDKAVTSKYATTKYKGEQEVKKHFPEALILRPSIIFGSRDNFFNQFARLSKFLPFLPLIGGGKTKFQPVYVEDVADVVFHILVEKRIHSNIIELGGPEEYTFEEILKFILEILDRKRLLLPLPFMLAKILGRFVEVMPRPFLTADQVELLKYDNIIASDTTHLGFKDFAITPQSIKSIVPMYLR
jgi:NADH dehydrogenase